MSTAKNLIKNVGMRTQIAFISFVVVNDGFKIIYNMKLYACSLTGTPGILENKVAHFY